MTPRNLARTWLLAVLLVSVGTADERPSEAHISQLVADLAFQSRAAVRWTAGEAKWVTLYNAAGATAATITSAWTDLAEYVPSITQAKCWRATLPKPGINR